MELILGLFLLTILQLVKEAGIHATPIITYMADLGVWACLSNYYITPSSTVKHS